jgi:uncharacterized protein YprB with RNaseH-like and TPR domain
VSGGADAPEQAPGPGAFLAKMRRTLGGGAVVPSPGATDLGALRRLLPPGPRRPLPAGHEVRNARGAFWLCETSYPLAWRHGSWPLGALLAVEPLPLSVLAADPDLRTLDLTRAVFLDTETTGLMGGAGTLVFMIGLGLVVGDQFVVRQVFLRAFGDEPAALEYVAEVCAEASALVTFFGKSFDRHRLADRLALHRMTAALREQRHLDLYWLHRRVHGGALPDGRLKTAEAALLGVRRQDDLPGALCPQVYLDWLRGGKGPIDRIFAHNLLDVLSLVTLTCHLARDPLTAGDARLCLAHGQRHYKESPERAADLFERAGARELMEKARRRAQRRERAAGAPTAPAPPVPDPGTSRS